MGSTNNSIYSIYFVLKVPRQHMWFFTATLREYEHSAFDRTLDKTNELVECFVTPGFEAFFVELVTLYKDRGFVVYFEKKDNRFLV